MTALKRRHLGALLATLALALSFFGLSQLIMPGEAAHAAPKTCPDAVTNVSNKVTLDWDKAQLVDNSGRETQAVGDYWDLGLKLPWKTEGAVKAGDYFTYDARIIEASQGRQVQRPNVTRTFDVVSHNNVVVGCGTWGSDGMVTVVFNSKVETAAQWYGSVVTNGLAQYSGSGNEKYTVNLGGKTTRVLDMIGRVPGEPRFQKDGWLTLKDDEDGDSNKAIMWRVIVPAGPAAVTGASVVDEVPQGANWSFDCATVDAYTKKHTYLVMDPTTSEGIRQEKDTSKGAFGQAAQVECSSGKVTVKLGEIPANQSAIVMLPARVADAKRASDVVGEFSNKVNFNIPGREDIQPVTKTLRYGGSADAYAHQTFSVTKKIVGELPESANDLDYTLKITLTNKDDASANKTFQTSVKAGQTYTYPEALPLGTEVTVTEGDLPSNAAITWNEAESRLFEAAPGVSLKAGNREAHFTLSDDQTYSLTLTNTLVPAPTPSATPSTPAPKTPAATPAPTKKPSPAPRLAATGSDAAGLGVLAGIVAIAGVSLVAARRRGR